ncbi:hypothetical protein [Corynebacterium ulcerans]|uniref:hypothetical protein n=1 Tax=Corynebacterium ulcerans TaxID=65058 RepID=UPI0018D8BD9D|nr:hypothetical protein [Corynebacterium ulcerans]MBH5297515.1 hypothetical protein [Corynebacterium ulcerans]
MNQFKVEQGLTQLLQGDSRNQVLKRAGRLVYRCSRGCLLGGVVHHGESGVNYVFEWQRTGVPDLEISPHTVAELLNNEPTTVPVPEWVAEYVRDLGQQMGRWDLLSRLGWDDLALPVERLRDVFAFGIDRQGDGSWVSVNEVDSYDPDMPNGLFMNCRHIAFCTSIVDLLSDLERVRRRGDKVVRIGQHGTVVD